MAHDLIVMGSSLDRSGADVNLPIAVGETHVTGNGVPGTGTQWYPKTNGKILGAFVNSETAAMVELWLRKTTDNNRYKLASTHLQTDPIRTQAITPMDYPINEKDAIECAGENAGAVLDICGMYVAKKPSDQLPTPWPTKPLPSNCFPVRATGAQTLTADALCAPAVLTFDDFTPIRDQWYAIRGMMMDGATALLSRLAFLEGPNQGDRPGVIAADTSTGLEYMMWYGDFGMFRGQTPPMHQTVGVAGDTAQCFRFLLEPVGGQSNGRRVA